MDSAETRSAKDGSHRLITRRQLQEFIPVSSMTIWRWEQDGRLPKHITIGRRSFWKLSEILRFISDMNQEG